MLTVIRRKNDEADRQLSARGMFFTRSEADRNALAYARKEAKAIEGALVMEGDDDCAYSVVVGESWLVDFLILEIER
jgi:hypothetical protein